MPDVFNLWNISYIEQMWAQYLQNPSLVSSDWRLLFAQLEPALSQGFKAIAPVIEQTLKKYAGLQSLIQALRSEGHLAAKTNPLSPYYSAEAAERTGLLVSAEAPPQLTPTFYGLEAQDLSAPYTLIASPLMPEGATIGDTIKLLEETYTGTTGAEIMVSDPVERQWLIQSMESGKRPASDSRSRKRIMQLLTRAETLERFLHQRFVGQKRFSLEGGETLIPVLDGLIRHASSMGVKELVLGMPHRGRVNVLTYLGKPLPELFAEFAGQHTTGEGAQGDVKYHKGFSSDISTEDGTIHVTLLPNPSHLEIVSGVVEGATRAKQDRLGAQGQNKVVPVILHGDASFPGQGVVAEIFNMSQTKGFTTGGSLHIVVNNQVGFTTDAADSRSARYATDVAKMIGAPVWHVNTDDPEAAIRAIEKALEYRMQFKKDAIVELVCFRKLGHNEADEPSMTQPQMYKAIAKHPGTRALYAQMLEKAGVIAQDQAEALIKEFKEVLQRGGLLQPANAGQQSAADQTKEMGESTIAQPKPANKSSFAAFTNGKWTDYARTAVAKPVLKQLGTALTNLPAGFELHPKLEKMLSERKKMAEGAVSLDWGMAKMMAYASLLIEGYGVRLEGQDSERGTFSDLHAILHNQSGEGVHSPLEGIVKEVGAKKLEIINSVLSELSALAFEYGYSITEPNHLVIWEAQFGDFANGAQIVIDQFITAAEAKWNKQSGIVLCLPHGYEGQGAEHSSARLERFLQLSAQNNIQVCVPSTPAQMFHLLRRQMLRKMRKPLVCLTPKSLLRHKASTSSLEELATGCFHPVLGDNGCCPEKVERVILCSGKVYYDLAQARDEAGLTNVAILRLEQLYPFPEEALITELSRFENATEFVLAQEEPENQGSYYYVERRLRKLMPGLELIYAGREESAAPACGHLPQHKKEQGELVRNALVNKTIN
jgi:2-oxoglutarate dehydrogenase E1 component